MDYTQINELTGKIIDAENKMRKYQYWHDELDRDQNIYGCLSVASKVYKRNELRIYLSIEELRAILKSRIAEATVELDDAKRKYEGRK